MIKAEEDIECAFCGGPGPLFAPTPGPIGICRTCTQAARFAFDAATGGRPVRLELAWGGHEGLDECELVLSPQQLSVLADTLVEVGLVAPISRLRKDERLRRAEDFLPDADTVVPPERVKASLEADVGEDGMVLLEQRVGALAEQFRHFLSLASFHGGYTLRTVE